jgi:hypothetical protein
VTGVNVTPVTALTLAVSARPADEEATTVSVRVVPAGAVAGTTDAPVMDTASVCAVTEKGAQPLASQAVPVIVIDVAAAGSTERARRPRAKIVFLIMIIIPLV